MSHYIQTQQNISSKMKHSWNFNVLVPKVDNISLVDLLNIFGARITNSVSLCCDVF